MIDAEYLPDILDLADIRLAEIKHSSPCRCGSLTPARLGKGKCSDCSDDWPRCGICSRWVSDGSNDLSPYVNTLDGDDRPIKVCIVCFGEAD